MTEAATQTVCIHCGADVRAGSLFCYNCGKSVAHGSTSGAEAESDIVRLEKAAAAAAREAPIAAPGKRLRERKRAFNRQPVEVTWSPRNDGATTFVISGLLIAALAAILIIAALYYR